MKKALGKSNKVVLLVVVLVAFFLIFGRVIFALFLPLETSHCIIVPKGQIVSSNELYEYPPYIDQNAEWFPGCFANWQIRQLARYMEKNNLYILPGQYEFYSTYYGDKLFEVFDYIDADKF